MGVQGWRQCGHQGVDHWSLAAVCHVWLTSGLDSSLPFVFSRLALTHWPCTVAVAMTTDLLGSLCSVCMVLPGLCLQC